MNCPIVSLARHQVRNQGVSQAFFRPAGITGVLSKICFALQLLSPLLLIIAVSTRVLGPYI